MERAFENRIQRPDRNPKRKQGMLYDFIYLFIYTYITYVTTNK